MHRGNDPNDRRARIVHLTPEGRELVETVFEAHKRDMEALFAGLPEEERASLAAMLKTLGRRAARVADEKDKKTDKPEWVVPSLE